MMSCREIVRTLSFDHGQPLKKNIKFRFHLLLCKPCSYYAKQLEMVRTAVQRLLNPQTPPDEAEIRQLEALAIQNALQNPSKE